MSTVSVVIPVHNGERYLAATLDSILAQTCPPLEIIVIDDASSDATPQILAAYAAHLEVIRHDAASGPARARNEGIQRARGEYIAFLDADDLWEPEKLAQQLQFAAQHPGFGILTTDVLWFDDDGTVLQTSLKQSYPVENGYIVEKLLRHNWITTSATLIPRDILLEVGGFDERPCRLGEDWVLWMQIASRYPVYFLDQVLTRRRVHADSLGHADPETSFRDLLRHLETLQQAIPQLRQRPELVREAAFEICLHRGIQDFHHLRMDRARTKLRLARQYATRPTAVGFWMAATYVPVPLLAGLKRVKRSVLRG